MSGEASSDFKSCSGTLSFLTDSFCPLIMKASLTPFYKGPRTEALSGPLGTCPYRNDNKTSCSSIARCGKQVTRHAGQPH